MKKIPTAKEFLSKKYSEIYAKQSEGFKQLPESRFLDLHITGRINGIEENPIEMMVEFARLHVEAALKEASEKAVMEDDYIYDEEQGEEIHIYTGIDKDSILNSYSLDNIK